MRKLTVALAVLASLGGASFATSVSATPAAPLGVTASPPVTWTGMHHRMMHRHHMMHHRMMHRRMMRRRMMHRM